MENETTVTTPETSNTSSPKSTKPPLKPMKSENGKVYGESEKNNKKTNRPNRTKTLNPPQNSLALANATLSEKIKYWLGQNYWYLVAFFLPVILLYISYAIFGMFPFGDESVLVLDLNGQYVYFWQGMHDALRGSESTNLFYSWSRNLSGEFMGIIGYYLASPFNLIAWIFPRDMILGSIYMVQLAKVGAAGFTFFYFLRKTMDIKWINGLIFSTCYALMAYMIVQLMDLMWLDGLVWLPIIVLGIRNLVDNKSKLGYIIPLGIMFFSHFYIGMMIAIFCVLYFMYYMLFGSPKFADEKVKKSGAEVVNTFIRFGICSIIGAMLSAVLLLPVYLALRLGKMDFSEPDWSMATQFQMLDVLPRFLPNSYDTVRPDGMMDIYAGAITTLFIPLFYTNTKIETRVKIGQTFLAITLLASMYIKPLDMLWHGGQMPNWLPFRYSFIFSFIILTMAAECFAKIDGVPKKAFPMTVGIFIAVAIFIESQGYETYDDEGTILDYIEPIKVLWFGVLCFAVYAFLGSLLSKNKKSRALPFIVLVLVSGELCINAVNTLKDIDKNVTYSSRSGYIDYVSNGKLVMEAIEKKDPGLWRSARTFQRTINDDMGLGMRGISHSSSVMNAPLLKTLRSLGYDASTYSSGYRGASPVTDTILGFKYILTTDKGGGAANKYGKGFLVSELYNERKEFSHSYYNADLDKNKSENGTPTDASYIKNADGSFKTDKNGDRVLKTNDNFRVYENPYALNIGYMVNQQVLQLNPFTSRNVFYNNNILLSSMFGEVNKSATSAPQPTIEYFKEIEYEDPILTNVTYDSTYRHYNKVGSGDHTVEFHMTVPTDDPVYLFLPTRDQQDANIWVSDNKSNGTFLNFSHNGGYFDDGDYGIMKVGQFDAGTEIAIRITVLNDYIEIYEEPYFCYLDMGEFEESINVLKKQQWEISEWSASHIKGTITSSSATQIMMTTIPYEPGWTVKVDGQKVETKKVLDSFIAIPVGGPGTHTVEMTFIPEGFPAGLTLCIIGIALCVLIYLVDKKHLKLKK